MKIKSLSYSTLANGKTRINIAGRSNLRKNQHALKSMSISGISTTIIEQKHKKLVTLVFSKKYS